MTYSPLNSSGRFITCGSRTVLKTHSEGHCLVTELSFYDCCNHFINRVSKAGFILQSIQRGSSLKNTGIPNLHKTLVWVRAAMGSGCTHSASNEPKIMFTTGIKKPSTVTAVTVSYFIFRSRRYKCNWSVSGISPRLYILQETMSRPGSAA